MFICDEATCPHLQPLQPVGQGGSLRGHPLQNALLGHQTRSQLLDSEQRNQKQEYNDDAMKNSPPSHLVSTAWMSGPLAAPSLALMLASCSRILTCSSLAATWARCWARHLLSSSLQRWSSV